MQIVLLFSFFYYGHLSFDEPYLFPALLTLRLPHNLAIQKKSPAWRGFLTNLFFL
jgi:hypothetical protein